jgi:hypothetical protein
MVKKDHQFMGEKRETSNMSTQGLIISLHAKRRCSQLTNTLFHFPLIWEDATLYTFPLLGTSQKYPTDLRPTIEPYDPTPSNPPKPDIING